MKGLSGCTLVRCEYCKRGFWGWAADRNLDRHKRRCATATPEERKAMLARGRKQWERSGKR